MLKMIVCALLSAIMAVNACTVWIIAPDSSTTGQFIIHKTRDRVNWRKMQTKLRWYPDKTEGKYRLLEFGDWMYMNEKGLFIFNTNIPKAKDAVEKMESISVTMRNVASQCADIDSAIALLKSYVNGERKTRHTFYIVSDHTGAVMVEISATRIACRKIENGFAVHSNHFFFPEMAYLNNAPVEKTLPSATRLEVSRDAIGSRLAEKGRLSEMDSLEISRLSLEKYHNMCPFRDSTVCCADYLPDSEYPGVLGTLLITPGPSRYAPAMSVPISIGAIPEVLENGELGRLSYEVKEKLPKDEASLEKFRALETQLRREYLECQETARKLLREGKNDEAGKLLDENVARQAKGVLELFKEVLGK